MSLTPTMRERKKSLREQIMRRLKILTPEQHRSASEKIQHHLLESELWKQSRQVALFAARSDEPETSGLMEAAWQEERGVLLPKVTGDHLEFYVVSDMGCLESGSFGLLEPNPSLCRKVSPSDIDLIVVPGLAFDQTRRRLGRGRGYYDRFLAQSGFRGRTVGLFFAFQEVEEIPAEAHDQTLDGIMTEKAEY
jgi:5-formyltetrahydrofolate cyclo-ligase